VILVKIRVKILPEKQIEFQQTAEWLVYSKPQKEGNLIKGLYQEVGKPEVFYYLEEWDTLKHFDAHYHSDDFQSLLGGMKTLGEIIEAKIIQGSREKRLNVD